MLWRRRVIGMLVVTTLASLALAMPSPASWRGVVRDVDGAPAGGAVVVLQPAYGTTAAPISVTTSTDGQFQFSEIPTGDYVFSVTFQAKTYSSPVHITLGNGELTSELKLEFAGEEARVTLTPRATETESSGGEHLSSGEVSSLPLNSRDFSKLLLLATGTMTDTNGAANFTQQFAVNGQRGTATVFALDSADTTDPEMGGATFSNYNVDAIQEVQSNSGVIPADLGHGGASYTNVVSKSGTEQVHGSVFEFVRNAAFDARNYFDHPNAISHRRIPPFVRNEFGFTNGGPIVIWDLQWPRAHLLFWGISGISAGARNDASVAGPDSVRAPGHRRHHFSGRHAYCACKCRDSAGARLLSSTKRAERTLWPSHLRSIF